MDTNLRLACLGALALGAALLLSACGAVGGSFGGHSVEATLVGSASEVAGGPPGAYFISEDRKFFHLRCPCGKCSKKIALPLEPGGGAYVWQLGGDPGKPSLSPSIHWFEPNGVTTHWHGWLRDGYFVD
jgi:hypothetical protein